MQQVIDKFFDLYLIQNKRYLLQINGGGYLTCNYPKKPLLPFLLKQHLEGQHTVGTFSHEDKTKFICFDIDYINSSLAKWITYKIVGALDRTGVHNYAVSFSGKKGYHIDLFLDKRIPTKTARKFYEFIIKKAEIEKEIDGKVEYRPSASQGIKLPLGIHQENGNFCGFCIVSDGLRVMGQEDSIDYFLSIEKTDRNVILNSIMDEHVYASGSASDMENVIIEHKQLETYEQSENYTFAHATNRYNKGMTGPGQRHNSFLLLARLMNHNGVDRTTALKNITEWLERQDKRFYSSEWGVCIKDAQDVIDFIYRKNLTLKLEERDLTVTFAEIDTIIRRCPQKNQKSLLYAILVHSKRWAGHCGTFYMTYQQMETAAGIDIRTAKRQINQLEELGVIEVIRRNQQQKGMTTKKPNVYRVTLETAEAELEDSRKYSVNSVNRDLGLIECLNFFYSKKKLRTLLTRKQYSSLVLVS